jgi:glucose-6-phosphate 1-dehydrogenase
VIQPEIKLNKRKIVLEGCNGEWAQKRYLPVLLEKAYRGVIELWAVDIEPQIRLDKSIRNLWVSCENDNKVHYLNKLENRKLYIHLSDIDFVFVVTPDKFHSKIAEDWIDRLTTEGKIFVEKPLDAFVRAATKLKEKIIKNKKNVSVFCFDHYYASIYPFIKM